jgi:hypothetical protein
VGSFATGPEGFVVNLAICADINVLLEFSAPQGISRSYGVGKRLRNRIAVGGLMCQEGIEISGLHKADDAPVH